LKFPLTIRVAALAGALVTLAACNGGGLNNIVAAGRAHVRLIDASPNQPGPLSLVVASTVINSNITAATPIGVYADVGSGPQTFLIQPSSVPAVAKNVAASTFYTVALIGEPGQPNFGEVIFQDTNSLQSPSTVRYKVNDAAPAAGTVDVYVYQGATLPPPTVPGLTAGQDSGSIVNPPGNAYIPTLGSATLLPSGPYNITVTQAGNASNVLFTGSATLNVGFSYSFTLEDTAAPTPAAPLRVILAIDQPVQGTNQASLMSLANHRI
jgi:Domain of unknown function (DUF4397)